MPDFFRRAHHLVVEGGRYIAIGRDMVLAGYYGSTEKTYCVLAGQKYLQYYRLHCFARRSASQRGRAH
jgi:hypothetical protein